MENCEIINDSPPADAIEQKEEKLYPIISNEKKSIKKGEKDKKVCKR